MAAPMATTRWVAAPSHGGHSDPSSCRDDRANRRCFAHWTSALCPPRGIRMDSVGRIGQRCANQSKRGSDKSDTGRDTPAAMDAPAAPCANANSTPRSAPARHRRDTSQAKSETRQQALLQKRQLLAYPRHTLYLHDPILSNGNTAAHGVGFLLFAKRDPSARLLATFALSWVNAKPAIGWVSAKPALKCWGGSVPNRRQGGSTRDRRR